jgi:hypothetical protein
MEKAKLLQSLKLLYGMMIIWTHKPRWPQNTVIDARIDQVFVHFSHGGFYFQYWKTILNVQWNEIYGHYWSVEVLFSY